ncbi:ImmA/IrrE family metallo-endopeptidase [Clostridium sp. UBA3887]|uniref:ImmA/IrrE family metallo-endopeptidase n=1 Tax=Clostridium sp. UBA3887 TaxID=1946356 RepID=UPI003217A5B5
MKNIPLRVKNLVKKYGTRDPFLLASCLNLNVKFLEYSDNTKGYYIKVGKNKFVIINSNLTEDEKRVVLAHEIGHAVMHSSKEIHFLRENTLFPKGRHENEANKFAAELLIDLNIIDKCYIEELSLEQLARFMMVPKELIELKFQK